MENRYALRKSHTVDPETFESTPRQSNTENEMQEPNTENNENTEMNESTERNENTEIDTNTEINEPTEYSETERNIETDEENLSPQTPSTRQSPRVIIPSIPNIDLQNDNWQQAERLTLHLEQNPDREDEIINVHLKRLERIYQQNRNQIEMQNDNVPWITNQNLQYSCRDYVGKNWADPITIVKSTNQAIKEALKNSKKKDPSKFVISKETFLDLLSSRQINNDANLIEEDKVRVLIEKLNLRKQQIKKMEEEKINTQIDMS